MDVQKKITDFGTYFLYPCLQKDQKKGTIIFIHGFATTSHYHDSFIKYINDYYDYLAIQLPGAGVQEWTNKKKPTVEDMVLYCADLIRDLDLDEFILLGHSMGGGIAVRVANLFKKEVKKLILSTPMNSRVPFHKIFNYFVFNPKTAKQNFRLQGKIYYDLFKTFNHDQKAIDKFMDDELAYQLEHRDFFVQLKKSMFSIKNLKIGRANEAQISCPTLVIAGKHDGLIPWKSLFKAFNKRQNKDKEFIRVEVMEESGHLPFQEQEEEYANKIIEFISI